MRSALGDRLVPVLTAAWCISCLKVSREVSVDLATAGDLNELWGLPLHAGSLRWMAQARRAKTAPEQTGTRYVVVRVISTK
jgi:hypothetical protein